MATKHTHCTTTLPEGYKTFYQLDLQKDKKTALRVNGLAVVVMLILLALGYLCVPLATFTRAVERSNMSVRLIVLAVGTVAYIVLHELVHGITMRAYGAPKVKFGFTGMYAFAGSDAYFDKTSYLVIALAPVVLWGVVLQVLCMAVDVSWFWVAYLIQVLNLSGAAGDAYVTWKFAKFPPEIWVQDSGTSMVVYAKR